MTGITGELISVTIKSLTAALFLFFLTRMLGKKQLSQLSFFDYIIGISIGSIAAEIVVPHGLTLYQGLLSMLLWALVPLVFSFFSLHSVPVRKFLDGTSTILMQDGKVIEKNLRKARFTVNDLLEELRTQGIFDIQKAKLVILETNGKISVLQETQSVTANEVSCFYPIIIDGKIIEENAQVLNINKVWIEKRGQQAGISAIQEILYAECDKNKTVHFIKKGTAENIVLTFQ